MVTIFLLVRHGQSIWNAEKRWQGQADPELSDLGRRQAYEAVSNLGQVDLIVSSPQIRAHETATIISEGLGIGPVATHDDLRERNAGQWSGLTISEIEEKYPGWLDAGRRPSEFEDSENLETRILGALNQMAGELGDSSVLVLCHGGVISSVEETFSVHEGRIPNLAGRIVHAESTDWSVGDRLMLAPETQTGGGPQAGRL